MGALAGIMEAQYDVLRKNGHSPTEAFNETVEELTQSLIRLVDENGMDWMYSNCSATAQRGALDWKPIFRDANLPVFRKLYESVKRGEETRQVIRDCGRKDYQEFLGQEAGRNARFGDVACRRGRSRPAPEREIQSFCQGGQGPSAGEDKLNVDDGPTESGRHVNACVSNDPQVFASGFVLCRP